MKLQSSSKQKKRYLVFEIISGEKFSVGEIEKEVFQALLTFLGELGVAQASPMFLREKFNQSKQRFILKVDHKSVKLVQAALILIKTIKNTNVIVKSLTTAGTIKKAKVVLDK
tara:strand:+ start:480 stop:818 length:339 start_codon:yes stop_codon:yes gene_type:complete